MKGNLFEFIVAIVAIFLFPSLYTGVSVNNPQDVSSGVSYESIQKSASKVQKVDAGSIQESLDNLCYISAEASEEGLIKDIFYFFMDDMKDNKAQGWTHIKEENLSSGLSWTLWRNNKDKNAYCLAYAGTDELADMARYLPMMMNEERCDQMTQAVSVAKKIKNYAGTSYPINKLYIVGHSLGGYLASYVMSDLVDYEVNPSTTNSLIEVKDISNALDLNKVKCVTFGAPGFYNGKKLNVKTITKVIKEKYLKAFVNASGGKAKITDGYLTSPVTSWGQEKMTNNKNGEYNNYIENYVNDYDPVGHLCIGEQSFTHLGKYKSYSVERIGAAFVNTVYKVLSKTGLDIFKVADIYYHLPHVYNKLIADDAVVKIK